MKRGLFLLSLLASIVSCVSGGDDDYYGSGLLAVGSNAPDFIIYTDDNPAGFSLSSLQGSRVMIEFWASWCPDCQDVTDDMLEMYADFASESLVFLGYALDTDEDEWRTYIDENNLCWLQTSDFVAWKENSVATAYGIQWIPTFYLIGSDGTVEFATVEPDEMREKLSSLN